MRSILETKLCGTKSPYPIVVTVIETSQIALNIKTSSSDALALLRFNLSVKNYFSKILIRRENIIKHASKNNDRVMNGLFSRYTFNA